MKKDLISENFFTNLAKSILLPKLERELTDAISKMEQDPSLASTLADIESLKYWSKKTSEDLKNVCKRNPNSPLCKEKGKK